jgi:hypothetical protein
MCIGDSTKNNVTLTTRAKDYTPSKEKVGDLPPGLVQPSPPNPPTDGPLHIERPSLDTVYDLPKVSLRSRHSILMLGQPRTIALSKI